MLIRRVAMTISWGAVLALGAVAAWAHWRANQVEVVDPSVPLAEGLRPVLLVPGWFDTGNRMEPLAARLRQEGWDSASVKVVTFDDPVGSNIDHATEIALAVEELLLANRGRAPREVDVVAHSMGGLAARWYLQNGGDARVRRFVTFGSPHRGTLASLVAWGEGGTEMRPDSEFLAELDSVLPEGVEGLTIRTELETHIVPQENATLPGVPDTVLCCSMHWTLPLDASAMSIVLEFLAEGRR